MIVPGVLTAGEGRAVRHFIERILEEVPTDLQQASLFGSLARGQARVDSDIDVLLIFRALPPDREPHAGHAERIAGMVAELSRRPLSVWSVSLVDLEPGNRTPMLVDALADSVVLWARDGCVMRPVPFTPVDAVRCTRCLLDRVGEGSEEFAGLVAAGRISAAAGRLRDDLVRLCTAHLLLGGETRPRRGEAVSAFVSTAFNGRSPPPELRKVFQWAQNSFGEDGCDERLPVRPPSRGFAAALGVVESVRHGVIRSLLRLEQTVQL